MWWRWEQQWDHCSQRADAERDHDDHDQLAGVITGQIGQLEGVTRTRTMVAFEVFSRHDLEALFSIGQ